MISPVQRQMLNTACQYLWGLMDMLLFVLSSGIKLKQFSFVHILQNHLGLFDLGFTTYAQIFKQSKGTGVLLRKKVN